MTALQNRYSISSSFCNLPDCFQNCYTFCRQDGGDCVCLEDLKIVLLSISIPTVTARNSFRIVEQEEILYISVLDALQSQKDEEVDEDK